MRHAILFSGMTERRHLNGLELCYRVLLERLGFPPEHVHVLTFDGSLRTTEDRCNEDAGQTLWPGDSTPYRIKVNGPGNRRHFRELLLTLGSRLTPDDLLFINTTGHGGNYGDGRGPYLATFPRHARYWFDDFCSDLALLPRHRGLVVLMAQCFSGGFTEGILRSSPAAQTYVASASARHSHAMDDDLNWDVFQRNWLTAFTRATLHATTVGEASEYAINGPLRHLRDLPTSAARPEEAAAITLMEDPVTRMRHPPAIATPLATDRSGTPVAGDTGCERNEPFSDHSDQRERNHPG